MLRSLVVRLRALMQPRVVEAELDEEMRYHLERDVERRIAHGQAPDRAAADARRAFGSMTAAREDAREAQRGRFIDQLTQDLQYALRGYRRTPGFTAVVLLS